MISVPRVSQTSRASDQLPEADEGFTHEEAVSGESADVGAEAEAAVDLLLSPLVYSLLSLTSKKKTPNLLCSYVL